MKKKITIHDLAKILNIDSSTVSRALANSPRVKLKTREIIQAKARELGYSRNTLASNLRSQKTKTIGVIVPHISRFFLSTVIAGIEEVAFTMGYQVIIGQSLDSLAREQQLIDTLLSSQVDGIIMSISMETDRFDHLEAIQRQDVPIVFIDRKCSAISATNIVIDDYARAFEATEHLIKNGRKNIAHFTGLEKVSIYQDRLAGYKAALSKYGIDINPELIFESRLKQEDGRALANKILKLKVRPDAIFSANDTALIAAMKVFHEHKISIPEDIAIFGFSNEPLGEFTSPSLSTVDQSPYIMGETAIRTILDLIDGKVNDAKVITIASSLVVRASSGNL